MVVCRWCRSFWFIIFLKFSDFAYDYYCSGLFCACIQTAFCFNLYFYECIIEIRLCSSTQNDFHWTKYHPTIFQHLSVQERAVQALSLLLKTDFYCILLLVGYFIFFFLIHSFEHRVEFICFRAPEHLLGIQWRQAVRSDHANPHAEFGSKHSKKWW